MSDTQEYLGIKGELSNKLQWFLFLRVIVGTFLLGSTVILQFKEGQSFLSTPIICLYSSIVAIYLLSFIYVLLFRWIKNIKLFLYGILSFDHLLVTFIVFVTGGILSVLSFLYPLLIITASILLYRRGGFFSASLSSILYGGLLGLEFYKKIHPLYPLFPASYLAPEGSYVSYTILVNTSAFFLAAFLSSYLSEGAKDTREKLLEKQVNIDELKSLNENIIQSMSSGLLTIDPGGKIISFNRAAEEIFGLSHQEIYLKKLEEILPRFKKYAQSTRELDSGNPSSYRNEMSFMRKDGREIYIGFSISSLKNSLENEIGKLLIFQDISRYIEMEKHLKQIERTATIGELGAKMAHEIRNPLASMCGSIQMLKEEASLKDRTNQRLMDIILREADRLDRLITNFLLFAKPPLREIKVVNLSNIIDDILEVFIHNHQETDKLAIHRNLAEDIWLKVDVDQIKQVFWNLLLNARQAMPEGGEMRIESKKQKAKGPADNFVEIKISDTGGGIPSDELNKIFDPFYTTKKKGTGLGLSVVKKIIESYHGEIRVDSKIDEGSIFFINFPFIPSLSQIKSSFSQR